MNIFEQRESEIRGYCRVYPTVFATASNARQTDENGKEYIDFFAGAGVLNFGHNNERMKRAVIDYIENNGVTHSLDLYTTAKRDFIQAFTDTILEPRAMPHKMQFTGPTGSNAVEAALKLARRVTARQQVVAFGRGFHGMTLGALACTTNQTFRKAAGVPLQHVSHQPFGCETTCLGCEMGCGLDSLHQLRARYADTSSGLEAPAAFLVETIQAEGGVNVASNEWLLELQSLARELGALLIVDDIQVGCGRTGSYFSFDNSGLDPDIICLAKGIGGMGTPLAVNLVKPQHDQHWAPGEHTGTFRGQDISFVAGREALRYFEDETLMAEVADKSALTHSMLASLATVERGIQLRGRGLIFGLDLGAGSRAAEVVKRCFENGLLVAACGSGGRVVKVIPPLTIPVADLQQGLTILQQAVQETLEEAA